MSSTRGGRAEQILLNLFRIVVGFLFWQHGAVKLFGWFGGFREPGQTAELASLMGVAGILEFFGGILIAVGLFTRPVAFILAGEMAIAYFKAHFPQGPWQIMNRGEASTFFAFAFLYLAARGGGRFSLDGVLRKKTD
jgi:putative oxidoreductase